jgi:hypothetical protein
MLVVTCFGLTGPSSDNTIFKESTALCTFVNRILNVLHYFYVMGCLFFYPLIATVSYPIERAAPLVVCILLYSSTRSTNLQQRNKMLKYNIMNLFL